MSVLYWLVLSYGRVTRSIVYTEQGENHGTMILHGVSYSAYTLRYGAHCRCGIAPSSQSSFDLLRSFIQRVAWVVLTSHAVSPNIML